MNHLLLSGILLIALTVTSCSSYVAVSKSTKVDSENGYIKVYNDQINFKSLTFGDFKFATTQKAYMQLRGLKPKLKRILVYAQTTDPTYAYYVLLNPQKSNFNTNDYIIKDTTIDNNRYVILMEKNAPDYDQEFIFDNINTIAD